MASVVCPTATDSTGSWAWAGSWFFTELTWVLISVRALLASKFSRSVAVMVETPVMLDDDR